MFRKYIFDTTVQLKVIKLAELPIRYRDFTSARMDSESINFVT